MANKKITLDGLAGMIKRGFDGVDKRFDENTEQHRQIFKILDKHSERFEHIEARLDRIENDLSEMKENMVYKDKHEDLKCRVGLIEGKIGIVS